MEETTQRGTDDLPFGLHFSCPAAWTDPAAQHAQSELLTDQCVIAGERFFLRGLIVLLITDAQRDFTCTIWVEVSENDFISRCSRWFIQGREHDPPVPARLAISLPSYGSTMGIPGLLQDRTIGLHPLFTLSDPGHPLARDQQHGISTEQAAALISGG